MDADDELVPDEEVAPTTPGPAAEAAASQEEHRGGAGEPARGSAGMSAETLQPAAAEENRPSGQR
eukprot:4338053-Lingulodinium_polyedra.AAC.1